MHNVFAFTKYSLVGSFIPCDTSCYISYTRSLFNLRGDEIPMWAANGTDMLDVYDKTLRATEYSRKKAAPSLLLYKDITRRFGHAATDRQICLPYRG